MVNLVVTIASIDVLLPSLASRNMLTSFPPTGALVVSLGNKFPKYCSNWCANGFFRTYLVYRHRGIDTEGNLSDNKMIWGLNDNKRNT